MDNLPEVRDSAYTIVAQFTFINREYRDLRLLP
ncbi:uncharacterized protein METZ01_LOCUS264712, partial [marine metagenome]